MSQCSLIWFIISKKVENEGVANKLFHCPILMKVRKELLDVDSSQYKASPESGESGPYCDISSLSWSDREKILQYLFAKIYNQAGHNKLYDLPAHTFTSQVQGDTSNAGPVLPT